MYLMNKNTVVAELQMENKVISKFSLTNPKLAPPGIVKAGDNNQLEAAQRWFTSRLIPDNRHGLSALNQSAGKDVTLNKHYASLSDQYWIRVYREKWDNINFFSNKYPTDVGDIAFGIPVEGKVDTESPDITTNGILVKRWIQNDDMSSELVKISDDRQDALRETAVSKILRDYSIIPYVNYTLSIDAMSLSCHCHNFITPDTELVPMSQIYGTRDKKATIYEHLMHAVDEAAIPGAKDFIDRMIFIDHLVGNCDRNLSNFGAIRNVNTGEYIGMAPLFDSGTALKYSATGSVLFADVEKEIYMKYAEIYGLTDITALKNEIDEMFGSYPEYAKPVWYIRKSESRLQTLKNR